MMQSSILFLTRSASSDVPVRVPERVVQVRTRQATVAPIVQVTPSEQLEGASRGRHIDRCLPHHDSQVKSIAMLLTGDSVPSAQRGRKGHAVHSPLFAPDPEAPAAMHQSAPPSV